MSMWNEARMICPESMDSFSQKRIKVIPLERVFPNTVRQMIGIFLSGARNGPASVGSRRVFNFNGRADGNMIVPLPHAPRKKDIQGDF